MIIPVSLGEKSYDVVVEKGALKNIDKYVDLNRKVLVITDDGVPSIYAKTVLDKCQDGYLFIIEQGENSKSLDTFGDILTAMLKFGFTRKDCVIAVGGGVVGDLSGFVASSFMRGVDFINIPTTTLSQIDSAVGGKTAVNLNGVKNVVGAFYQPKKVIVDIDTLATLPTRHFFNGYAEGIKMAVTFDSQLFELIEKNNAYSIIEEVIKKSIIAKKTVVEQDEKEQGLRKILNYGHTVGHGIESTNFGKIFHGEAVALGMLAMSSTKVRDRLITVLKNNNLIKDVSYDWEKIEEAILHDKKSQGNKITTVQVEEIGTYLFVDMDIDGIISKAKETL